MYQLHKHVVSHTMMHALCGHSEALAVLIQVSAEGRMGRVWRLRRLKGGTVAGYEITEDRCLGVCRQMTVALAPLLDPTRERIIAFSTSNVQNFTIHAALVSAGAVQIYVPGDAQEGNAGAKGPRKKFGYALDEPIGFGKFGPSGEGLTIRQVIDRGTGRGSYIEWCIDTFGEGFLGTEARAYYDDKLLAKDKQTRKRKPEPEP